MNPRTFVPAFHDRYQSNAYRLDYWTVEPDGHVLAHFGDGRSAPSVEHLNAASLERATRHPYWVERTRETTNHG
jgi:hypothetical protein